MAVERDRILAERIRHWKEAAARYESRRGKREAGLKRLRAGQEADDPERVLSYARREAEKPESGRGFRALVRAAMENPGSASEKVRVLERRIGPSLDWSPNPSNASAKAAGRAVGRICSSPEPRDLVGIATGFLVAPSLLLTNHHVFAEARDAVGTFLQFGYEIRDGAVQPGVFFEIDPALFFTSNGDLDFALVGVKPISTDQSARLSDFRPHRLIAETGKILVGHRISIIQHPDASTKRYAEHENKLLDVLEDFVQYSTDTLPGSSGSPCFNAAWEVVALHHSGVPRMRDGQILRADGGVWDQTMDDNEIDWLANEGARVSRVVAEIQKGAWEGQGQVLIRELLEGGVPIESTTAGMDSSTTTVHAITVDSAGTLRGTARAAADPQDSTIVHVHGAGTCFVHCAVPPAVAAAAQPARVDGPAAVEKKLRFDSNYAARQGYSATFLGTEIPLPGVAQGRRKEMVKVFGNKILVLPYHHFSLAMNRKRRLQMWSAVNVDYSSGARRHAQNRDAFGDDTWILDERLPAHLQIQDLEFYKPATAIDRGHMVRRDDNCWGGTFSETEFANADTFHWTNCTPQHERFNQSRVHGLWGGLEDVIKARAEGGLDRVSIFAGPVLDDEDPDAYGIQYPVRFWKVVTAVVDGELEAYGFVLDQSPVVDRFGLEVIDFGKFTIHQRPLAQIEAMTGVAFPDILRNADVLLGHEAIAVERPESVARRQGPRR